jgi:hypothetical protein
LPLLHCLALAQTNTLPYDKQAIWFSYFSDLAVNDRVALHFDTSYRLIDDTTWRQWVVRPGINVDLSDRWSLSLTYGYFKANPNGLHSDVAAIPEHRVHQQLTYRHALGRLAARHRIRNEERWIGAEVLGSAPRLWHFQERLRYQFRTDIPVRHREGERPSVFFSVYDEVAARFGLRGTSYFDQNRLYGGMGFRPKPSTTVEFGAFAQRLKPLSGDRFEHNIVVLLSVSTDFSIKHR